MRVLTAGGIVAYPTETVYGLAVDVRDAAAVARMIACKGRDEGRGISLLVDGLEMAAPLLASSPPEGARQLARHFWPGPLTIVLPASPRVAPALLGPGGGVGLRCSSDPWALALVRAFGHPLTSTSANRSGMPPARSAAECLAAFPSAAPLDAEAGGQSRALAHARDRQPPGSATTGARQLVVLDGGPRESSEVSTVVEFPASGPPRFLRRGAVAAEALARHLPDLVVQPN